MSHTMNQEMKTNHTFLQQIGQDPCSKQEFGKPLSTTLATVMLKIWEEPLTKDILLNKSDTFEIPSNCKVLQTKKVNPEV